MREIDDRPFREKGARLKEARLNASADFRHAAPTAEKFKWNTTTYSHHESGRRDFAWETAKKYATAYGCDPVWLMGEGTKKMPAIQKGGEMVGKHLSLAALRVTVSILRPDLAPEDAQALAAVFLSLALDPPDSVSAASFEDQLRGRFQGALAARSVEK